MLWYEMTTINAMSAGLKPTTKFQNPGIQLYLLLIRIFLSLLVAKSGSCVFKY